MMGASGTGKTYNLRNMISQIQKQDSKVRIHILDFHGDIQIDGASSVKFSESTNYGINPLIINPNPDFGGVRKRIQSFITALDRTSRLGSKQQAVLRNLLTDLYIANGFYPDKPSSWVLDDGVVRKHPKITISLAKHSRRLSTLSHIRHYNALDGFIIFIQFVYISLMSKQIAFLVMIFESS